MLRPALPLLTAIVLLTTSPASAQSRAEAKDMALAGYRLMKAKGDLGEPEWPTLSLSELLDVAFKDRVIGSEDHPIFNKLLGRL